MPKGFKNRGKSERKDIYDFLQEVAGRDFTKKEFLRAKALLLKYVKSEVFVFIAKSDKDKKDFLKEKE